MSDKLEPLVDGVKDNRKHWLDIAAAQKLMPQTNHDRENHNEESVNHDSKPNSPNSECGEKIHNNGTNFKQKYVQQNSDWRMIQKKICKKYFFKSEISILEAQILCIEFFEINVQEMIWPQKYALKCYFGKNYLT